MSYDIRLKDPVTNETLEVPGHLMTGGMYKADYDEKTKTFSPALNTEAYLNITFNYSNYYYEVYNEGIKKIEGMSGIDSIPVIEKMIENIKEKYKKDGEWITTKRNKVIYYDKNGNEIDFWDILGAIFNSNNKDYKNNYTEYTEKEIEYEISEGDTSDYWESTAANAIKPLHQLIALAKMRPEGIWEVSS